MRKHFYLFITVLAVTLISSCKKDFDEINKDPNGFTGASDGALFNNIIKSLHFGWDEQLYVNQSVLYKETQQVAIPFIRWSNYSIGTEDIWRNYYSLLPNVRELENRFSALDTSTGEVKNMQSMLIILKAFKTFKVTDLFGDIPYFEAGKGFQNFNLLYPRFDTQQSIYLSLLNDLRWASDNIAVNSTTEEPFLTFKNFDNLFSGDMKQWRKFANSLLLRYSMRMVNKEPALAGSIIKDIIENNKPCFGVNDFGQLVLGNNEVAMLMPSQLGFRNESKGWAYNQSREIRMGSLMWQYMSKHDSTDGSGIFDPRAYYFFETNNYNKWIAYPNDPPASLQPDGGEPYDYQRDNFYSVKGTNCNYSPVNYYLARDMDNVPDVLISGAEVLFLRAEAYHRGIGVSKDIGMATISFLDAINFSLNFWENTMQKSKLPSGVTFQTNITVPSTVNFFSVQQNIEFFTASEQDQLKEIYRQQWIEFFRQPQEAFALSRRTGLTPHIGPPATINKFPIPPSEVSNNLTNWLNSYANGDDLTQKVWWMN